MIGYSNSLGVYLLNPYIYGTTGTSYLLDTYSAAAAYSLRQLKTGVTNVVRVRRSSDNAESNFSATDITDGTLTTWTGANDGFVVTWYDQSGGGNNVTQATAANQPRIVASGVVEVFAGGNGIYFENDSLQASALSAFNSEPFSFVYAINPLTTGVRQAVFDTNSSGAVDNRRIQTYSGLIGSPEATILIRDTTATNYIIGGLGVSGTDYLRFGYADSSKNVEGFTNGVSNGTFTYTGTFNNDVFNIGTNRFPHPFKGHMGELIVFNSDESANRTAIESDINTYYWGADLLLDTYSGAAAAYSLRKLSKFTTNVVRVRRSSDNAESDFTATEITDGTLTTWTGANDGFVVTWYDQSGNGNSATQATAANQPKLVSSGTVLTDNSKPMLDFDGTNDGLYAGSIGLSGSTLRSVFAVCNQDSIPTGGAGAGNGFLGVGGAVSAGSVYDLCPENGRFALRVSGNSIYNTTITLNTQYLWSCLQTTTTTAGLNVFKNGTSVSQTSTTSTTLNTTDDWYIGQQPNEGDVYMDGGIQEIIIMASDESANRTAIESDINTYYSIY